MANTYSQIHVQIIFAVKYRDGLIRPDFQIQLYQYIHGIISHHTHKVLAINGMPDHVHILIGLRPTQSVSDLVQIIKANSSKWINEEKFLPIKFEWQAGYGVFSYSKSQIEIIIDYIHNQENHHRKKTFREEYLGLLKTYDIDYDELYVFVEPI
jgi:putative transposase